MCGRFTLTAEMRAIAERFGVEYPRGFAGTGGVRSASGSVEPVQPPRALTPRYNIAPTQSVIVVNDTGQRQLVQMRWGFIRSWTKPAPLKAARRSPDKHQEAEGQVKSGAAGEDKPSITLLINARAETITQKPAFRTAFKGRRCLIPADGFYEWQKQGKQKQPVRIVLKNREPFGFAGLWEHWTSPEGDELLTCTIITTAANELLRQVHERMPVILSRENEAVWLDPKIQDTVTLLPLLKQYPSELMEFYPVARIVSSPANDTPECIVPI